MCGIAGFVGADRPLLDRMLRSIVHRGPDGPGRQRRSLLDRHAPARDHRRRAGDQPLYSDDGNLALVFNGEIYNHAELRRELEGKGRRFVTDHSDTEVILRGFEEWGREVVDHLTGMFAFAISDREAAELFLARDRLGIKPLYYVDGPGGLRVRVGAEGAVPGRARRRVGPTSTCCAASCCSGCTTTARTRSSTACKRLLPGHTMLVRPDGIVKIERYWNPPVNPEFASSRSDDDYAQEFAGLWDERRRAATSSPTCPVGVPLSGGLDSSGVVSTMARLMRRGTDLHTEGLYTFSALYPGREHRRERVHPRGRAGVGSIPHYAYPHARRLLERDRRSGSGTRRSRRSRRRRTRTTPCTASRAST